MSKEPLDPWFCPHTIVSDSDKESQYSKVCVCVCVCVMMKQTQIPRSCELCLACFLTIMMLPNPKPVLLATRWVNKSRDESLGQGTVSLFGKPAAGEDDGPVSQSTVVPELEFRLLL